ncbi:MAG: L-serine ammonia-lyase [Bdellovibrio sp.]|nr:L-serine ammonia-lyase [Bdellovibrio sp.]
MSVFDIFKIGIGPSSSHTVGPMKAALCFINSLVQKGLDLDTVSAVEIDLFSSLAWTGKGHGIERALVLGLSGESPESVENLKAQNIFDLARQQSKVYLLGKRKIVFDLNQHIHFLRSQSLPLHPNGMNFRAIGPGNLMIFERNYYSIGGGFVVDDSGGDKIGERSVGPLSFSSGQELLELCQREKLEISALMAKKEEAWMARKDIQCGLEKIWKTMQECVKNGLAETGLLPGNTHVPRRAPETYKKLLAIKEKRGAYFIPDPLEVLDWVNLYALAVNEENASGGRVVTAPTNGAAGIIPAVLLYYRRFCPGSTDQGIVDFLLTAGAIGILYKKNASISGAEVGCQGEVGVACSMAAAGLTEALGGTIWQVENAAEIAMEHNLGLTCDPVGGMVQIPCIERNAMGAIKAINASRLALMGDGHHQVSLDEVIKTMRETGLDMQSKYKETSTGGLAVNVTEC